MGYKLFCDILQKNFEKYIVQQSNLIAWRVIDFQITKYLQDQKNQLWYLHNTITEGFSMEGKINRNLSMFSLYSLEEENLVID